MALFLPLEETIDSSLAVTLSDWEDHWLRVKEATEAISPWCLRYRSLLYSRVAAHAETCDFAN